MLSLKQLDEVNDIKHDLYGLAVAVMYAHRVDDAGMCDCLTQYAGNQLWELAERLATLSYYANKEREDYIAAQKELVRMDVEAELENLAEDEVADE